MIPLGLVVHCKKSTHIYNSSKDFVCALIEQSTIENCEDFVCAVIGQSTIANFEEL